MGWTQWWAATQTPPSLRWIVPEVAPPDQFCDGPYQTGIPVRWAIDWGFIDPGMANARLPTSPYCGGLKQAEADGRIGV